MDICVIGLGSMGKRRIRLLKNIDKVNNIYGVDSQKERRQHTHDELNINCYNSLFEVLQKKHVDGVVISTPPLTHSKIIKEALENNLHVFTEINLINDNYENIINLSQKKNKILFLSSTFLYRNEIKYIKEVISHEIVNYKYHVGQYLPDWHPWESYKDFFVGDKRTNGCRELFAIELPWIVNVFGEIKDFYFFKRKSTNLEIDYDDTYVGIIKHENGTIGTINVDIVSRIAKRELCVYGENIHLAWNGTPDSLYQLDFKSMEMVNILTYNNINQDKRYAKNIIENAYQEELENYINCILNMEIPKYTFSKDKDIIDIINKIEKDD
ncbi:Gfo/Idh/MocA family oxidoreductase [Allocoprobacillus halotolerans]|uniref:Gfo/Idh/MocA family oxidoreductase n=1 Tax=Allocoprobacillus halotolerans TaxID=2944914 RepID=A0ABY5HZI2_9FIRM|nr:Gfo/Idh/MocA family oxidoreductase [Allocoprobacillus halotolerans]UTY38125.1 Gfo/Idh/MocA family oxidoreductase [Allocoprobacillus halotolerans]